VKNCSNEAAEPGSPYRPRRGWETATSREKNRDSSGEVSRVPSRWVEVARAWQRLPQPRLEHLEGHCWNSAIERWPPVSSGSATSIQLPNHPANPSFSRLPYPSLCLKKIFSIQPMLRNRNCGFPQRTERYEHFACRESCPHFRMESLPFDGDRRLSASKILLFPGHEAKERRIQENRKAVVSRINRSSPFAFYELGTRFPAGWFPLIRKQIVPSRGADGTVSPMRNQRTIFHSRHTSVACRAR
jgi:hypothetical protein